MQKCAASREDQTSHFQESGISNFHVLLLRCTQKHKPSLESQAGIHGKPLGTLLGSICSVPNQASWGMGLIWGAGDCLSAIAIINHNRHLGYCKFQTKICNLLVNIPKVYTQKKAISDRRTLTKKYQPGLWTSLQSISTLCQSLDRLHHRSCSY